LFFRSFESKASSFANDSGLADTSIPSFLKDFKVSAMFWCLVHSDDNSRCNPGKSDVKMSDNTKKQTRVLTDYMANLYMKFVAENPTVKLSRATFCRMRPTHILTTNFISRSTCLCTKHQNIALTLKSLRKEGIDVSVNPESFAKEEALDSKDLKNKLPALVKFSQ
jgi:hypothetical protein